MYIKVDYLQLNQFQLKHYAKNRPLISRVEFHVKNDQRQKNGLGYKNYVELEKDREPPIAFSYLKKRSGIFTLKNM